MPKMKMGRMKKVKILVLADHESKALYEYFEPEKVKDVDLVLACGDSEKRVSGFLRVYVPCAGTVCVGKS